MNEESLFVAALEKPTASERQAFLDEACAGDVALREQVERLLAAHTKSLGILDQSARPPGWPEVAAGSTPAGVSADELVGAVIGGRYTLLEEIGAGGMGTVWKAKQRSPFKQEKYAAAEPLLVQGYDGLKARQAQIPPLFARQRVGEAGQRVVRLYEAWGQAEKAAEWRTKLLSAGEAKPAH